VTSVPSPGIPGIPSTIAVEQNYPNPFNHSTVIRYHIPAHLRVNLTVYNVLGQVMQTLVDEEQAPGSRVVRWNAGGAGSGVYFYRLQVAPPGGSAPFRTASDRGETSGQDGATTRGGQTYTETKTMILMK